jgi:aminopeptidase N
MMKEGQATAIHRLDYAPPAFWIDTVDLAFDLDPAKTRVLNRMRLRRNPAVAPQPLRLHGEELNLARVLVDGAGTSFKMEGNQLVLENLPEGEEPFALEIFTTCAPAKNTQLSGLYVSGDTFFTQCEAEGFRRITYFLDRPDVMASYTVTLRADKASRAATWKTAATSPSGTTRTRNPATCSRWWRASWSRASSRSEAAQAATICCRSMCAPAIWKRPSTR